MSRWFDQLVKAFERSRKFANPFERQTMAGHQTTMASSVRDRELHRRHQAKVRKRNRARNKAARKMRAKQRS